MLRALYRDGRKRGSRLWWTRDRQKIRAVSLVAVSRGNVGFVYYSPPSAPGVDCRLLVELVAQLSAACLRDGLPMVQVFLDPDRTDEIAVLSEAGLEPAARLIEMRRELPARNVCASMPTEGMSFVDVRGCGLDRFKQLIAYTYTDSLDCPKLLGRRNMDEVIESHKHTGIFTPAWWNILMVTGEPAGCFLLNRSASETECRMVYIGVIPAFRGRGIGTALLVHAFRVAASAGCGAMRLAVDADNTPALRLYSGVGFYQTSVRQVLAKLSTADVKIL